MKPSGMPEHPKDHLELLYQLSQVFNSSLDLDEVLNRVIDEVIMVTGAERGFVMLRQENGELAFHVARGIDQTVIQEPRSQVSFGTIEKVAREGEPILTSDAQTDTRLNIRESVMILGLRSVLCVPLKVKDRILGVVYVDSRIQVGIFTNSDLELLSAIASSAAVAIENARLYQLAVEKGRLERELQVARQVQSSLLPHETPQIPGWEFTGLWMPARQVSGDFYDFIPLSAGTQLGLVIADVTDKGMPAALFMALSRTTVRASVSNAPSPAEGISRANRLLCADSPSGMFVTLFYAQLNAGSGEVVYVNAGQNPPLLCSCHEDHVLLKRLARTGMALGVEDSAVYEQETVQMEPGDLLLLYTDGVTDAINTNEQAFGMQRLEQVFLEYQHAPIEDLMASIRNAIQSFSGTGLLYDDITMVIARRL